MDRGWGDRVGESVLSYFPVPPASPPLSPDSVPFKVQLAAECGSYTMEAGHGNSSS
jgi:hypothetical protein